MNSVDYSENICQAIEVIVKKAISELAFDTTIVGYITKKISNDEYQIRSLDKIFTAFDMAQTGYNVGDQVYVLIPQNDYSNRKIILNSKFNKNYISKEEVESSYIKQASFDKYKTEIELLLSNLEDKTEENNITNESEINEKIISLQTLVDNNYSSLLKAIESVTSVTEADIDEVLISRGVFTETDYRNKIETVYATQSSLDVLNDNIIKINEDIKTLVTEEKLQEVINSNINSLWGGSY